MFKSKKKKLFAIILTSVILIIGAGYFCFKVAVNKIGYSFYLKKVAIFSDPNFVPDIKNLQAKEVYRFYWSRTFHHPVLITVIVNNDEQGVLNLRVTGGAGGYEPGKLIENKDTYIKAEEIHNLREIVNSNQFWKQRITRDFGLDGASWTIEVKYKNKYYFGGQWSPKSGSIRNIGMYMINMSGLNLAPNEVY